MRVDLYRYVAVDNTIRLDTRQMGGTFQLIAKQAVDVDVDTEFAPFE